MRIKHVMGIIRVNFEGDVGEGRASTILKGMHSFIFTL